MMKDRDTMPCFSKTPVAIDLRFAIVARASCEPYTRVFFRDKGLHCTKLGFFLGSLVANALYIEL